jgi:hypothetical protein
MINFNAKEVCMVQDNQQYKISVCFNGEFYQTHVLHPPSPMWNLIGIGKTETEAINNLMDKLSDLAA